jgi:predicted RNA polymerase sigma factor
MLVELMRDEPEALGLLSLLLLHDARRPARLDSAGDLVTLEEQDRRSGIGRRSKKRARSSVSTGPRRVA